MGARAWDRLKADAGEAYDPKTGKLPARDPRAAGSQAAADRIGGDLYGVAVAPLAEGIRHLGADPEAAEFLGSVAPAALDPALRGAASVARKIGPPSKGGFAIPKAKGPPTPLRVQKPYGGEHDLTQRLDNALYRLRGNTTADKLEAKKFLEGLPKAAKDPAKQEALYHALEHGIVDPKRKLAPEHAETLKHFDHYYKEQTDLVNDIRKQGAKSGADVEPYLYDQGYVARRAEGHSPMFDGMVEGNPDPILGRGPSLAKSTTALKSRVPHVVMQAKDGTTHFIEGSLVEREPERYAVGKSQRIAGKTFTIRPATTAEIEANTGTRYHKNALLNTVDNVVRLRQTKRNLETLDSALSDLKDHNLARRSEWTYKDPETGRTVLQRANSRAPDSFVELGHIPQLKGWKFDPRIAEVFKDYKPGPDESLDTVLAKVNRGLTGAMFWNPIPHAWNVTNHWAVSRGFDWVTPGGTRSLFKNGARAMQAVLTQNEDYRNMLREGSGLMYGDTETRNFNDLMLRKGISEIAGDREAMSGLMKSFDLKGVMPQKLVAAVYRASNKALWGANDVLQLQRQFELMDKGHPVRDAIRESERDIPNYRIPSRVMNSRAVSQALRDPKYFLFGRYRYGLVRAWGEMFKDMYKGSPEERTEAAGKFLVAGILAAGAYPVADHVIQKVTGNKEAKLHRGGGFGPLQAGKELSQGQRSWMSFVSTLVSPSPALNLLKDTTTNRDQIGRPILNPEASPRQNAVSAGEWASGYVNPAQQAVQMTQPGGLGKAVGRNLMVDYPPDDIEARRARAKKYNRSAAKSRAKRDPLMQWGNQ